MDALSVLLKPVITEKSARLAQDNQYVFAVHPDATKIEIASAVASIFKVKVKSVRTVTRLAKIKRRGARWSTRGGGRRAIVTIAAGQQLDVTGIS